MKQRNLENIWAVPKYLPYVQPKLTKEILQDAEQRIGFKLPKEYIALLEIQNGGYIRYTLKDSMHTQISGIGSYFPSLTDFDWLEEHKDYLSFETSGLFPFDGDGHWNICLDYRKNKLEPEITYIDTESDFEEKIAENFKEYLQLLIIETEDIAIIETSSTIVDTVTQIATHANIEFEVPGYDAHGYSIYQAKFEGECIFISPNKVPLGFIRKGEERYEELKHIMDEKGVQYPEIDENYLLLSSHNKEILEDLIAFLNTHKVSTKKLSNYLVKNGN